MFFLFCHFASLFSGTVRWGPLLVFATQSSFTQIFSLRPSILTLVHAVARYSLSFLFRPFYSSTIWNQIDRWWPNWQMVTKLTDGDQEWPPKNWTGLEQYGIILLISYGSIWGSTDWQILMIFGASVNGILFDNFDLYFFFLGMIYSHCRMVFKRETVKDPERVLDLTLVPQVYCEVWKTWLAYSGKFKDYFRYFWATISHIVQLFHFQVVAANRILQCFPQISHKIVTNLFKPFEWTRKIYMQ